MTRQEANDRQFFESLAKRDFLLSAEGMRVYEFVQTVDPAKPLTRFAIADGAAVRFECARTNLKLLASWGHVIRARVIRDKFGYHYLYAPAPDPPQQKPTLRGIEMHKRRLWTLMIGKARGENPFVDRLRSMADELDVSYSHVQRAVVELRREGRIREAALYHFDKYGCQTRLRAGTRYWVLDLPEKGHWTEPGALAAVGVYEIPTAAVSA